MIMGGEEGMTGDKKIYKKTILYFLLTFLLCAFVGTIAVKNKMSVEMLQMEGLILENSYRIYEVISKQLFQTKALAALVIQGDGVVSNFQKVADVIAANEPALANFILAPDGIVLDAYPIEEAKAVIGLDFFDEHYYYGNIEAILARDTGELVMAGPFILRQGILGLVGRYPVYIHSEAEENIFWGLVSVSLKFPEALDGTGLSMLEHKGFSYQLWRINPDTNAKQIIASGNRNLWPTTHYVEKSVQILNAEWYFRIFPIRAWYEHPEAWLLIFAGLAISILVAFLVQNNITLKAVKYDLQNLTGTLNRMAVKFLAQSNRPFNDLMTEEIGFLADIADIDRLSVWRNSIKPDGLHFSQIYRWEKASGGTTEPLSEFADVTYSRYAPNWEKAFAVNEVINKPVRLMPEHEASILKALGIVSAFVAPIFIDNVFWGFVLFEDHRNERYFKKDHARFMRSAAFLFANAVIRYEMERAIAESNEFNHILYSNSPIGVTTFDEDFKFIDCNEHILNMLAISEKNLSDYINEFSPEYQPDGTKSTEKALEIFKRVINGEKQIFEWTHKSAKGELIPCEVTTERVKHKGKFIGLSYVYDLRRVRSMEKKITQLEIEVEKIFIDSLTGIYNRRYFDENIGRIIKSLSRAEATLSLMMIDIDFFKNFNDTYGHKAGDICLKMIAETLSRNLPRVGDFTARYGGEEFVVVLSNTDENGAQMVAEKLLESIRKLNIMHEKNDAADCVTISIGIISGDTCHKQKADDYIIQADKMLYESKQNGRNKYTAGKFQ